MARDCEYDGGGGGGAAEVVELDFTCADGDGRQRGRESLLGDLGG